MIAPEMAGWNLALRFGIEVAAFTGLAMAAWTLSSGGLRWIATASTVLVAATIWGVFNVLNDPSRSGEAPVEVSGWTRLAIELAILGAGAAAFAIAQRPSIAIGLSMLIAIHYVSSWSRIDWLIQA